MFKLTRSEVKERRSKGEVNETVREEEKSLLHAKDKFVSHLVMIGIIGVGLDLTIYTNPRSGCKASTRISRDNRKTKRMSESCLKSQSTENIEYHESTDETQRQQKGSSKGF
ncbi:transmembrane protein, putative [Medicago truncatula]|uniref:Transmembrane protein, putative n=1 Tax=Medicago truncatula TaxID=3880 RepID=A0A072VMT8_MEDTR|nr:transmembrane protein, putative [Medicago truncatula]